MARLLSISNFKRYPPIQALFWTVIVWIVIEAGCHLCLPESLMVTRFYKIRDHVKTDPAPDIIIMGDSVSAGGILASMISSDTCNIRNYSIGGGGPVFSYLLFQQILKKDKLPRAILLAHSPHTFSGVRFPVLIGKFAYLSELPGLMYNSNSLSDTLYGILTRFSYVLSYREQFKSLLKGDVSFFRKKPIKNNQNEEQRIFEHLYQLKKGTFIPRDLGADLLPMYKESFRVSEMNRHYTSLMLKTAREKNVAIYWATMPVTERVVSYRHKINYHKDFYAFLDQFANEELLLFMQRDFLVFEDALFNDLSHLNISGSIKYTKMLNEKMVAYLLYKNKN